MANFVIVVDTQCDFMLADGALPVAGASVLPPQMTKWLLDLSPDETAGVLFTFDTHTPEVYAQSEEAKQFSPHCMKGTMGWANMLDPRAIDADIPVYRLEKSVFDMWAEADVQIEDMRLPEAPTVDRDGFFQTLANSGVKDIFVIGVAADFCVKWAVDGLVARGFQVHIPATLTRGIVRQIDQVIAEEFTDKSVHLV